MSERFAEIAAPSCTRCEDERRGLSSSHQHTCGGQAAEKGALPTAAAQAAHAAFHGAWGGLGHPLDLYALSPIWKAIAEAVLSTPTQTGGDT